MYTKTFVPQDWIINNHLIMTMVPTNINNADNNIMNLLSCIENIFKSFIHARPGVSPP